MGYNIKEEQYEGFQNCCGGEIETVCSVRNRFLSHSEWRKGYFDGSEIVFRANEMHTEE
jgi:hypothetical protein